MLDIDPTTQPDLLCDARELQNTPAAQFDAIYCSHNLEHYHRHEVAKVLAGFMHVLKPHGFAYIRVPDILQVMRAVVQRGLEPDDTLYTAAVGPIQVLDVLYGWGAQIERSGVDFFAHKTGFSPNLLSKTMTQAGFATVYVGEGSMEVTALGFRTPPDAGLRQLLGLPPD